MGVAAAIVIGGAAIAGVAANTAAHAETNANTAKAEQASAAQDQINKANQQQTDKQNAQAEGTAAAQARVRAMTNPDGNTILTSPLGAVGGQDQRGMTTAQRLYGATTPSAPTQATTGKSTLGG